MFLLPSDSLQETGVYNHGLPHVGVLDCLHSFTRFFWVRSFQRVAQKTISKTEVLDRQMLYLSHDKFDKYLCADQESNIGPLLCSPLYHLNHQHKLKTKQKKSKEKNVNRFGSFASITSLISMPSFENLSLLSNNPLSGLFVLRRKHQVDKSARRVATYNCIHQGCVCGPF